MIRPHYLFFALLLGILGLPSCIKTVPMEEYMGISEGSTVRTREKSYLQYSGGAFLSNRLVLLPEKEKEIVLNASPNGIRHEDLISVVPKGTPIWLDHLRHGGPGSTGRSLEESSFLVGHVQVHGRRFDFLTTDFGLFGLSAPKAKR